MSGLKTNFIPSSSEANIADVVTQYRMNCATVATFSTGICSEKKLTTLSNTKQEMAVLLGMCFTHPYPTKSISCMRVFKLFLSIVIGRSSLVEPTFHVSQD